MIKQRLLWFGLAGVLIAGCTSEGDLGKGSGDDEDPLNGYGGDPAYLTEEYLRGFAAGPTGSGAYGGIPAGCEHRVSDFEPVEVWVGHIENFGPNPDLDGVEVRFARLDEEAVEGQVLLGEGPWNDAYRLPPSNESIAAGGYGGVWETDPFATNFVYTLVGGSLDGNRLRFDVQPSELYCAWCGELPVMHTIDGGYSCAPISGLMLTDAQGPYLRAVDTGEPVHFSYQLVEGCSGGVCECDASGCTARGFLEPEPSPAVEGFDVTIESDTVARGSYANYNVRFEIQHLATGGTGGAGGAGGLDGTGDGGETGAGGDAGASGAGGAGGDSPVDLDLLAPNDFVYQANREWQMPDPGPQFPFDPLSESDYVAVTDGETLTVRFPNGGSEIEITDPVGGDTTVGELSDPVGDALVYDLDYFAGGRFVVWMADGGTLAAEHTVYGSGVPVISSTRGDLTISAP